jgi:hypothetical protein
VTPGLGVKSTPLRVTTLGGLRPLADLREEDAYQEAWKEATPHEHEALDEIVLAELSLQDR